MRPSLSLLLLALASLLPTACLAPSQRDPARHGSVSVWFGAPDWASSYQSEFRSELASLEALGPAFVQASDAASADVVVHHWDSGDGCAQGVGRWTGGRDVDLDPVCAAGNLELRAAFGHEVGHAIGMGHVCRLQGEASDCDTAVGYGVALMNPSLVLGDSGGPDAEHAFTGEVPSVDPTALDIAEFNRTR